MHWSSSNLHVVPSS